MAHIVTRQHADHLWYWCSIGSKGEELMRSNLGHQSRAAIEIDLRVLRVLMAKPGVVTIELIQSSRAGDWRAHLVVDGDRDYEASSAVWYLQQCDAQAAGDQTIAALSQAGSTGRRRRSARHDRADAASNRNVSCS